MGRLACGGGRTSLLAWRLLRDRLPTKSNLVTRGILSPAAHFCVSGCGEVESTHHLFLSCSTFGSLMALVYTWIDISPTDSISIRDHFVQFTSSTGGSKARRSSG
ncbi:glutamate-gated kainate-type ion channel receptor subunit GluR8 [Trifolium pratense]|uniref:Glutamate-gated kainate-type ion channel receptor subunit GluR8 n=1 Tax=Trifolium pratense TaxID=57577 RepID=A0A2K3MNF6_TRIPR|nr:glutamate-gated kainate-type ion channel receptor subunit GluR8 [Trifolium pratense]